MRRKFQVLDDFFARYRYRYVIGVLFFLAVDVLQLLVPRLLGNMTDEFREGVLTMQGLLHYVFLIIGIALLVAVGRYFWRIYLFGTARLLDYNLRNKFFAHLETLSADFFNRHKTGELMAHATNDIHAVRHAFGQGIMLSIDAVFLTIATVSIMLTTIDTRLVLLGLLPLPFVALVVTGFSRVIHSRFLRVQEAFAGLTDFVQENLSGIRVVKAFVQEEAELAKFMDSNETLVATNMHLVKVWGLFWPLVQYLAGLSFVVVLGYGGKLVVLGDISLGDFVAFTGYLGIAIWPMMAIGWVVNTLQRGMASMDRLNMIFRVKPKITDREDVVEIPGIHGQIEFRNLTFEYPDATSPVLRGITLQVPQGMTLGILGRTGSGKSTLTDLLVRVYDPSPGELLIDGMDITKIPLAILRRDIGYVPQDNFLFSTSIGQNIGFASCEFSREEVEHAAELAGVKDDIEGFPEGFDTLIGERGVTLSGGQKQRVTIARALIKDPRILILDDCFSAVDTRTEERILKSLRDVRQGRTTVLISHRISTLKEADEIIVLDEGQVVERGDHESLVAAGGLYAEIHRRQLLEAELSSDEET
jgi:ATP-binding cassette subfamily B multidrug efflux pump